MRMLLLVAVVCLGGYALLAPGDLDEDDVRTLYERYWDAFAAGDSAAVCEFFHEDFDGTVMIRSPAGDVKEAANKHTACEGTVKFLEAKKALEQKAGNELFVNIEYTVHDVTIDTSGDTAMARMTSEVRVGTEKRLLLKIIGQQSDRIVRSGREAKFEHSQAEVSF